MRSKQEKPRRLRRAAGWILRAMFGRHRPAAHGSRAGQITAGLVLGLWLATSYAPAHADPGAPPTHETSPAVSSATTCEETTR